MVQTAVQRGSGDLLHLFRQFFGGGRRVNPPLAPHVSDAVTDRWATLPGEYDTPRLCPLHVTFAPLAQAGESAAIACGGYGPCVVHLAGQWRGIVAFEMSADGVQWVTAPLRSLQTGATEATTATPGVWRTFPDGAARHVRARVVQLDAGAVRGTLSAAPTWGDAPVALDRAA